MTRLLPRPLYCICRIIINITTANLYYKYWADIQLVTRSTIKSTHLTVMVVKLTLSTGEQCQGPLRLVRESSTDGVYLLLLQVTRCEAYNYSSQSSILPSLTRPDRAIQLGDMRVKAGHKKWKGGVSRLQAQYNLKVTSHALLWTANSLSVFFLLSVDLGRSSDKEHCSFVQISR